MRTIIRVIGILVIAALVIACTRLGPRLTTRTEVPVGTPYEIMLQQGDSLPFQHWDEPF